MFMDCKTQHSKDANSAPMNLQIKQSQSNPQQDFFFFVDIDQIPKFTQTNKAKEFGKE